MSTFLGQRKDDAGVVQYFITEDGEALTRDLNDPSTDTLYWLIKETGGSNVTLNKATLKVGIRAAGDDLEVAETEAEGAVVANAQVVV